MTRLDMDEAIQMWGEVVQDAFLNTPIDDPFHGWLIEQTKGVQEHVMKKFPSISVSGVDVWSSNEDFIRKLRVVMEGQHERV